MTHRHDIKKMLAKHRLLALLLIFLLLLTVASTGCSVALQTHTTRLTSALTDTTVSEALDPKGHYSTPVLVALFLHNFGTLPENYITKKEAEARGWVSHEGNLWDVADGYSIGGDRFYNREGRLPEKQGRTWFECDVNYQGGYRGPERLVYSNDGLIYYTDDHYATFTCLYDGG